jgi:hypothetical protein
MQINHPVALDFVIGFRMLPLLDLGSGLLSEVQGTLNPLQRSSKTGATWVDPIQPHSGSNHWSQCG